MWIILLCNYIVIKESFKDKVYVLKDYTPGVTDLSSYSPIDKNINESPAQSSFVFYACKPRLEFTYVTQSEAESRK